LVSNDFLAPEIYIFAFAEIGLVVTSVGSDVVELDEGAFFLVESVNFEVVLMEVYVICAIVKEDAGIDLLDEDVVYITLKILLRSCVS
jgi:hypothetical protein